MKILQQCRVGQKGGCGNSNKIFKGWLKVQEEILFLKYCRKYFFSNRIINDWNNLPEDVVSSLTLNEFKRHIPGYVKDDDIVL